MKGLVLIIFFITILKLSNGQDSLLTYTKVVLVDSVGKNEIFDRCLIWCSRTFNNSNFAIKVKEKEGGIIAGKAFLYSKYKYPWREDLLEGSLFSDFYFDWLVEVKEGKFKYSATNITTRSSNPYSNEYILTNSTAPYRGLFQSQKNANIEYRCARDFFFKKLDNLINLLKNDLLLKRDNW